MRRHRPNQRGSKKHFTNAASQTHKYNIKPRVMRGGIRL